MVRLTDKLAYDLGESLKQGRASAIERGLNVPRMIDDAITAIDDQLNNKERSTAWTGELIDRIAAILSRVGTRNMLSGEHLDMLRKALLSPRELTLLNNSMKEGIICAGPCNRKLWNGEVVTIEGSDVYCSECRLPAHITCKACKHRIDMNLTAKFARAKRACPSCKAAKEAGVEPRPPIEHRAFPPDADAFQRWAAAPAVPRAANPFRNMRIGQGIQGRGEAMGNVQQAMPQVANPIFAADGWNDPVQAAQPAAPEPEPFNVAERLRNAGIQQFIPAEPPAIEEVAEDDNPFDDFDDVDDDAEELD